ncbi:glyoxalase [Streptococcus sp.]|uniref:glyoxalase n=1 Tax=Streptococcus sp. TaxID=1306 RepID=UPI0039196F84
MFSKNLDVMLCVNDVAAEKVFWEAVGFDIVAESEVMGFETFDMKSASWTFSTAFTSLCKIYSASSTTHKVRERMRPSILFETEDIEGPKKARITGP